MPETLACVRYKDIVYCWNEELEQIEVFSHRDNIDKKIITIAECPDEVIYMLLKIMSHRKYEINRESNLIPFDITDMPQFTDVDGSLYVYNYVKNQWYRFSVVESVPDSIKIQAINAIKKAELLKSIINVQNTEDN